MPKSHVTVVEHVAEQIAFRIAAGIYAAGSRLPSVRQLAAEFGINPSTVQNVLGRLQSEGFTVAHRGAGHMVQDVARRGGISTLRYQFMFAQRFPDRAAQILTDLLATRVTLVMQAERAIVKNLELFDRRAVELAIERLDMTVAADATDVETIARVELDAMRVMLICAGQPVVLAIFNSIGEILLQSPAVLKAMYAYPALHVSLWQHTAHRWNNGGMTEEEVESIGDAIRAFDRETVQRFRQAIDETQR